MSLDSLCITTMFVARITPSSFRLTVSPAPARTHLPQSWCLSLSSRGLRVHFKIVRAGFTFEMQARNSFRPAELAASDSQVATPSNALLRNRRVLTLHEVDTVLISNSRLLGTTYYTLKVYTNAPTSPSTSDAADWKPSEDGEESTRQSQYQIERTTADFKRLRASLNHASHLAHKFSYCDFCKELILYLDTEDKRLQSSMFRLLVGQDKVARSLEEFINVVLAMLAYPFTASGAPLCSGQVQSHQVLHQFLLPRARND